MRRVKHILALATFSLAIQTTSAQLTYPIVGTNQTLFYDNSVEISKPKKGDPFFGQDANYIGNAPSYRDNGDGTITDMVTGLVWQKGYELMSYDEAMAAAEALTLGGYSDWRLPSIKEAYSLIMFNGVDASSRDMGSVPEGAIPFLDTNYFDFKYGSNGTRAIDTQMLSSTKYVGSSANDRMKLIFGVNMADGRIKGYPITTREGGKQYTVRFVRGAEYGVNNFVDNGNKTISDKATGLMWQKNDSGKGMNWQEALEYAALMNKKKHLGYNDWRVPDAKELQSIIDYSRSPESTMSAAIDPIFKISEITNEVGQTDYPFFWSSTTHCSAGIRSSGGSAAAYLSFGRGLGNMVQMQMGTQRGGNGSGGFGGGNGNNGGNANSYGRGNNNSGGGNTNGNFGGGNRSFGNGNGNGGNNGGNGNGQYAQRGGGNNGNAQSSNWINIHGAGCQRSDPKTGNIEEYTTGRGPQGDAIRIYNYVRLVRDIK